MIELADVFRHFGSAYLNTYGETMLPSHRKVISDVINCRTPALGGHVYGCDSCQTKIYAYHSCKNRHCPKCHTAQTRQWIEKRQTEMLPIPYFHITATIPEPLRSFFRSHQSECYGILMRATAESIMEMGSNPKHIGGIVGILMVLHTWTQQLIYHPHAHCLVTGGGVSHDGTTWHPSRPDFFVPVKPLARLIRGKVMAALKEAFPNHTWPRKAWRQDWVVDCTPWGQGEQAVLDYLARYAFRIAITNGRILAMDDDTVTFRFKDRKKQCWRTCKLSGEEFIRRFLQHVLPRGFHKVRYFGLWHHAKREISKKVRLLLELENPNPDDPKPSIETAEKAQQPTRVCEGASCPSCKQGKLVLLQSLPRPRTRPP